MKKYKIKISFITCAIMVISHMMPIFGMCNVYASSREGQNDKLEINTNERLKVTTEGGIKVTTNSSIRINFNTNIQGSLEEIEPQIVKKHSKVTKPKNPLPVQTETEKHEFSGWAITTTSSIRYWDFDKTVLENHPMSQDKKEITLWAQWNTEDLLGTGTKENPFIINNSVILSKLSKKVNEGSSYENCYFKLGDNITLEEMWVPIGTKENPFKGHFDGDFHSINNIKINSRDDYEGLFGVVESGSISNLSVTGNIVGKDYVGSIVAYAINTSIVKCYSTAILKGENYVGGIVGANYGSSNQRDCFITGNISGKKAGAITSLGFENNQGCYFLDVSIDNPLDISFAVAKDKKEFASGEVAYLLDRGGEVNRTSFWSQGKMHPIFLNESNKEVYKINTEIIGNGSIEGTSYAQSEEDIKLTIKPKEGNLTKLFTVLGKHKEIIAEGSGKDICSFKMPSWDVKVRAEFVPKIGEKFSVTFNANGGIFMEGEKSLESKSVEVIVGEKVREPILPVKQGGKEIYYYKFLGWFTDKQCTKEYNFNLAITEDLELYAKWEAVTEIKVKFNSNSKDVATNLEEQIIIKNKGDKVQAVENPIWVNTVIETHEFLGWSKVQSGEGSEVYWNFETDNLSRYLDSVDKETNTLTLYGQWKVIDLFTTGTKENPFKINNAEILASLASKVNTGNKYENCYFQLTQNIDLSSFHNWIPIGNENSPFGGHFIAGIVINEQQGAIEKAVDSIKSVFSKEHSDTDNNTQYCKITGLNIDGNSNYCGLFGNIHGGSIENLTVSGVIKGGNNIGGIVGNIVGESKIINCTSKVSVIGNNSVGGLIGNSGANIQLDNCMNVTTVSGIKFIGGVIGSSGNNAKLENCINVTTVSGIQFIGGIVGSGANDSVFKNCTNEANITGSGNVAGIGGKLGDNIELRECSNTGEIITQKTYLDEKENTYDKVDTSVAGIVGEIGNNIQIYSSFNTGDVRGNIIEKAYVGGIIGNATGEINSIIDSYNIGNIVGNTGNVGGIAGGLSGVVPNVGRIKGCYNKGKIEGGIYTGGLFGRISTVDVMRDSVNQCYNAGDIESHGKYVGGIMALLPKGSIITDCYNTGNINSTNNSVQGVGGITGVNHTSRGLIEVPSSYVENSYNYGKIVSKSSKKVGAITGYVRVLNKNTNCYYLDTTISNLSDKDNAIAKTENDFKDGEVSYILDEGSSYLRKSIWSQNTAKGYPIFADHGNRPVYRVKLTSDSSGTVSITEYVKAGSTATIHMTPHSGNIIERIVVKDSENNNINLQINGNMAKFLMPEDNVKVAVSFINIPTNSEHLVAFDSCGGTAVKSQKINAGERVIEPEEPTKEGERFLGWYKGEELYNFTTTVTEGFTLIAKWQRDDQIKVQFNVNRPMDTDGSAEPETMTVIKNSIIEKPQDPVWNSNSSILCYEFHGWYTQRVGGVKWDFAKPVIKDIKLYAQWIKKDGFDNATSPEKAAEIVSPEELRILAERVNAGNTYKGCYIKLGGNIDLNDLQSHWESIGFHNRVNSPSQIRQNTPETGSLIFEGNFDGKGYKVKFQPDQKYPFFGCIGNKGVVTNLKVEGVFIPNKLRVCFGGITGFNFGTISNCSANISSTNEKMEVSGTGFGGISGVNIGIMENCSAKLVVTSGRYTGGITGILKYGEVRNCVLKDGSKIIDNGFLGMSGGIVGAIGNSLPDPAGVVKNCYTEAGSLIVSKSGSVGGIVGHSAGSIINCVNGADIESEGECVGGILGYQGVDNVTIDRCINNGNIKGRAKVGGIMGQPSKVRIINSYSTGKVIAIKGNAGGISGGGVGSIENCYWYGETIEATGVAAAICPNNMGENLKNCYYGSTKSEITDVNKGAVLKNTETFGSGEVTYLLDKDNIDKAWTLDITKKIPTLGTPHYSTIGVDKLGEANGGKVSVSSHTVTITDGESTFVPSGMEFAVNINVNKYEGKVPEGMICEYELQSITLTTDGKKLEIANGDTFITTDEECKLEATFVLKTKQMPDVGTGGDTEEGDGDGKGDGDGEGDGDGDGTGTGTGDGNGNEDDDTGNEDDDDTGNGGNAGNKDGDGTSTEEEHEDEDDYSGDTGDDHGNRDDHSNDKKTHKEKEGENSSESDVVGSTDKPTDTDTIIVADNRDTQEDQGEKNRNTKENEDKSNRDTEEEQDEKNNKHIEKDSKEGNHSDIQENPNIEEPERSGEPQEESEVNNQYILANTRIDKEKDQPNKEISKEVSEKLEVKEKSEEEKEKNKVEKIEVKTKEQVEEEKDQENKEEEKEEEKEKVTVFEVIKEIAHKNPLVIVWAVIILVVILSLGGVWQYRKSKK